MTLLVSLMVLLLLAVGHIRQVVVLILIAVAVAVAVVVIVEVLLNSSGVKYHQRRDNRHPGQLSSLHVEQSKRTDYVCIVITRKARSSMRMMTEVYDEHEYETTTSACVPCFIIKKSSNRVSTHFLHTRKRSACYIRGNEKIHPRAVCIMLLLRVHVLSSYLLEQRPFAERKNPNQTLIGKDCCC